MTNKSTGDVDLETDGAIAVLRLARSEKMNALTPFMLGRLADHVRTLDQDEDIRVVLVTSDGDRAFCTGADINAFAEHDALGVWREWVRNGHRAFAALAGLRQPSIAVVQGAAFGGGLELAMACDLRVAADTAQFGLPEVGIGTLPGWGGTSRLGALVGPSRAKRLVFTGEAIAAATAERWGLVDLLTTAAKLHATADNLAKQIASRGPVAVQLAKQSLDHATPGNVEILEALTGAVTAITQDRAEGIAAFRERRSPQFLGH
jgi:enoyl-CoA hydratase